MRRHVQMPRVRCLIRWLTSMSNASIDAQFLFRAVALAEAYVGRTAPNPPVGAVCVRDGVILGEGAHQRAGTPHAEVHCLSQCPDDLSGATLYVTLEPCSTAGRTPPCCDLILKRRPARVVIGCLDPNPRHAGGAIPRLEAAGIQVCVATGEAAAACQALIAPFAKAITTGLPYVRVKLAMTLDGYLADRTQTSRWVTGAQAREWVQHQRLRADAIMVGAGTARIDHPSLQPHLPNAPLKVRVLMDRHTPIAPADRDAQTLVATEDLGYDGAHLEPALRALCQRGINEVFCEGGGQLAAALLEQHLVDELILIYAPKVLGDPHAVRGLPILPRLLAQGMTFTTINRISLGEDTALCLRPTQV